MEDIKPIKKTCRLTTNHPARRLLFSRLAVGHPNSLLDASRTLLAHDMTAPIENASVKPTPALPKALQADWKDTYLEDNGRLELLPPSMLMKVDG